MKIGLLGGSFNPVHVGHMMVANYMAQFAGLDEVWMMLSPQNPLKDSTMFFLVVYVFGTLERIQARRASHAVAAQTAAAIRPMAFPPQSSFVRSHFVSFRSTG